MKRVLITGASGDLGRPLSAQAVVAGWDVKACYLTNPKVGDGDPFQVDLAAREKVVRLIKQLHPDVIIHTALSDRQSPALIPIAAENLMLACQQFGTRLITISTDMVFDGRNPPYSESSPPTPLSEYGRAKSRMEELLLHEYSNCLIIRTSLLYDFDFGNKQLKWMLERIGSGDRVRLFSDEIRNPINTWNLAQCLLELADRAYTGILNIGGPTPVSRYEYGCELLTKVGINPLQYVIGVRAADIAPDRPRNLSLDVTLAQALLKTPLLSMTNAFELAHRIKAR